MLCNTQGQYFTKLQKSSGIQNSKLDPQYDSCEQMWFTKEEKWGQAWTKVTSDVIKTQLTI